MTINLIKVDGSWCLRPTCLLLVQNNPNYSEKTFFRCSLVWNLTLMLGFTIIVLQARWSIGALTNKESNKLLRKISGFVAVLSTPRRAESTPMPSPRCSIPRWRKHSRRPLPEWKEPSVTPSKWPGTEVTWTLCKDFLAIRSAIPRENPRIRNLSPLSLTNYSFSWSLLRLPISETIRLSLRTSAHTGVAISWLFRDFSFS